jgi:c-di-GMP-binding flagellar brake protein YcgR
MTMGTWAARGPAMETVAQRRRAMRRGIALECEAVAEDGFRLLGTRAIDLSPQGLLLETRGAFARVGEEVIVSFRPPRCTMWVDALARVARLATGRRRGDRAQAVGLSFVSMDPGDRALLAATLRGLPPPVPWRAPPRDYAAVVRSIARP